MKIIETFNKQTATGPANDIPPEVQIEIRAADLDHYRKFRADEVRGWNERVRGMSGPMCGSGEQAGWLAHAIIDPPEGVDWPPDLIARIAPTHEIGMLRPEQVLGHLEASEPGILQRVASCLSCDDACDVPDLERNRWRYRSGKGGAWLCPEHAVPCEG